MSLAGVPLALVVFVPTFRGAYQTLRQECRIDNQVLDATRVALCVMLRYDTIMAMNALLQAGSQKFFAQSEADFRRQIEALPWTDEASAPALQELLTNAALGKSSAQADGEASAGRMAPWMMACFALSWPILGLNRAAAFLTTGFGVHLRTLGPFTARTTVLAAAQDAICTAWSSGLGRKSQSIRRPPPRRRRRRRRSASLGRRHRLRRLHRVQIVSARS